MPREENQSYKPYFTKAEPDLKFEKEFKWELIDTEERFERAVNSTGIKDAKILAVDWETKGLDWDLPNNGVGLSVGVSSYEAYYFPFRHYVGNLPTQCMGQLFKVLQEKNLLMYNKVFDLGVFEAEGMDINLVKSFEVMALVYNLDSNVKNKKLKGAAKEILGRTCPEYSEVLGEKAAFWMLTPKEGAFYACCDAANTFALFYTLFDLLKAECPFTLKLDNELQDAMNYYRKCYIEIDKKRANQMAVQAKMELRDREKEIFKMVGRAFNLNSRRELSNILVSLGLDTGAITKAGDLQTGKKLLEKVDHPLAKAMIEHASLVKQLGSYIEKFTTEDRGRIAYQTMHVPTGRFASGNRNSPYFMKVNIQQLTKSDPMDYWVVSGGEDHILGYSYIPVLDGETPPPGTLGKMEGQDPHLAVRTVVTTPGPNWYYVSFDYSMEELVLAGQFSQDPVMMDAFRHGRDLHKEVAIGMWGIEKYCKALRQMAKICNFGLLYGGNAWTIKHATGKSDLECRVIVDKHKATLRVLEAWKKNEIRKAYQNKGVVYTAFGRPRRLGYYLSDNILKGYGERSVVSHKVQGTGGDVIRICMINLKKKVFQGNEDKVRFVATVHDSIDIAVKEDALLDVVPQVKKIMELLVPGTTIPLSTTMEVGRNMGYTFSHKLTPEGKIEPQYVAL